MQAIRNTMKEDPRFYSDNSLQLLKASPSLNPRLTAATAPIKYRNMSNKNRVQSLPLIKPEEHQPHKQIPKRLHVTNNHPVLSTQRERTIYSNDKKKQEQPYHQKSLEPTIINHGVHQYRHQYQFHRNKPTLSSIEPGN